MTKKSIVIILGISFSGLVLITLLVIAFIASQRDEPLSEDSLLLLDLLNQSESSDAYLYHLGIMAAEGNDPLEMGKILFSEYQKQELDDDYEIDHSLGKNGIDLPKGPLFCSTKETGCFNSIFSTSVDIPELLDDNRVIIDRSNQLHSYSHFRTLTKPSILEQLPPYSFISVTRRLGVHQAVSEFREGHVDEALNILYKNLTVYRNQLAIQDTLIGKVIYAHQVSELLDVISLILNNSDELLGLSEIPRLSGDEKNFELVIAREFAASHNLFQSIDKTPNFFEESGNTPEWYARLVYKPNMTSNAVTPVYKRAIELSRLNLDEFYIDVDNFEGFQTNRFIIKNPVGAILAGITLGYDKYVGNIMDLDAKIYLFNSYYQNGRDLSAIKNPFSEELSVFQTDNRLCLEGPLEDENYFRCIALSFDPVESQLPNE